MPALTNSLYRRLRSEVQPWLVPVLVLLHYGCSLAKEQHRQVGTVKTALGLACQVSRCMVAVAACASGLVILLARATGRCTILRFVHGIHLSMLPLLGRSLELITLCSARRQQAGSALAHAHAGCTGNGHHHACFGGAALVRAASGPQPIVRSRKKTMRLRAGRTCPAAQRITCVGASATACTRPALCSSFSNRQAPVLPEQHLPTSAIQRMTCGGSSLRCKGAYLPAAHSAPGALSISRIHAAEVAIRDNTGARTPLLCGGSPCLQTDSTSCSTVHSYQPPHTRLCLRYKFKGVDPTDLPPGWEQRLRTTAAQRRLTVAASAVRRGCIELTIEALALGPHGAANTPPPLTIAEVLAALGIDATDGAEPVQVFVHSSHNAATGTVPRIVAVEPRVLLLSGGGIASGTNGLRPLQIAVALDAPALAFSDSSPQVELLVRDAATFLPAAVTAPASHQPPQPQQAGPEPAAGPRPPLQYTVQLASEPSSPGLLLLEARSAGSAPGPVVPLLVLDSADMASELRQIVATWSGKPQELDDLLYDLGVWLAFAEQHMPGAAQRVPFHSNAMLLTPGEHGRSRMLTVAAGLLQFAVRCRLLATARRLFADLHSIGMDGWQLVPGALLTPGSPSLLRCALAGRSVTMAHQVVVWRVCCLLSYGAACLAYPAASVWCALLARRSRDSLRAAAPQALLQALGLCRRADVTEARYREYVLPLIATQAQFIQGLELVCLLALLLRGGRHFFRQENVVNFIACGTSVFTAAAWLLQPPAAWARTVQASMLPRHICYMLAPAAIVWGGLPAPPGIHPFHAGMATWLMDGVIIPASCLISPQLSVITALIKAPMKAHLYMAACQAGACTYSPGVNVARALGVGCLSVVSNLAIHCYLRMRYTRYIEATCKKAKEE